MRLLDSLRRATSAGVQPSLQFSETSEVAAARSMARFNAQAATSEVLG
jgi:hypothetical protein